MCILVFGACQIDVHTRMRTNRNVTSNVHNSDHKSLSVFRAGGLEIGIRARKKMGGALTGTAGEIQAT